MPNTTTPIRATVQLRAILRALRQQRNMTQAELGKAVGVSQKRIARIELNPALISVEQFIRILSALGGVLHLEQASRVIHAEAQGTMSLEGHTTATILKAKRRKILPAKKAAKKPLVLKDGPGNAGLGGSAW